MKRTTKKGETPPVLAWIVDELIKKETDGDIKGQLPGMGKCMQTLEASVCLLPSYELQIRLDKLLKMNPGCSFRINESESAVAEQFRKHLSRDHVYKLTDF